MPQKSLILPYELLEMIGNYCQVHQNAGLLSLKGWTLVKYETPEIDKVKMATFPPVILDLIEQGCLSLLKLWYGRNPEMRKFEVFVKACMHSPMPILKWALSMDIAGSFSIYYACVRWRLPFNLDIVKFLVSQNIPVHDYTAPISIVASNGYLEAVKYFHIVWNDKFTSEVMDYAAWYGRLEIVKFLHENRIGASFLNSAQFIYIS